MVQVVLLMERVTVRVHSLAKEHTVMTSAIVQNQELTTDIIESLYLPMLLRISITCGL